MCAFCLDTVSEARGRARTRFPPLPRYKPWRCHQMFVRSIEIPSSLESQFFFFGMQNNEALCPPLTHAQPLLHPGAKQSYGQWHDISTLSGQWSEAETLELPKHTDAINIGKKYETNFHEAAFVSQQPRATSDAATPRRATASDIQVKMTSAPPAPSVRHDNLRLA